MSTERQQSAINEVRDQLSLDYADGVYLNNATANLGITRPPFGFDDDTWRAVTKVLALQYKQIRQKFADVLAVLFGPQITQGTTLAQAATIGDRTLLLTNSDGLPQTGTVVLSAGLVNEETTTYSFIDRSSNTMYLDSALTFNHVAAAYSEPLPIVFTGAAEIYLYSSSSLPTTYPFSVTLSPGTEDEETCAVTNNNTTTGVLTVPAVNNTHIGLVPSEVNSTLALDYVPTSEFITATTTTEFPTDGFVRFSSCANTYTATGGTLASVFYAPSQITADRHVGSIFVFDGNVTPALAGVEILVTSNTGTVATFIQSLPAAPAAGDTFTIKVLAKYTRNNPTEQVLQLSREIPDVDLPAGTRFELLRTDNYCLLSPVKVQGSGWDIFQVNPRLVEIYLPADINDPNSVRSAAYLHPEELVVSTTLTAPASPSDTGISVTSTVGLPPAGAIVIDAGGGNEELVGYSLIPLSTTFISTGSTTTTLNGLDSIFSSAIAGQLVYVDDPGAGVSFSVTVASSTATSVTFADPIPNETLAALRDSYTKLTIYDAVNLITEPLANSHLAAETVDYAETPYPTTNLLEGNNWTDQEQWPGPYLYDIGQRAPTVPTYHETLAQNLSGPTTVACSQLAGATALEVTNATSFPLGAVSPYRCLVGVDTGNRETITVQDVNLRFRTATTVATGSTIGDMEVQVAALTGGGTADTFPNVSGYRVLLGRGTVNEEIVLVDSTDTGPDRLVLQYATTHNHGIGETVELLADVLSVDPLDDNHDGFIRLTNRLVSAIPQGASSTLVTSVLRGASTFTVSNASAFPVNGRIRIQQDEYTYTKSGNTINILNRGGVVNPYSPGVTVYALQNINSGERVQVIYEDISVSTAVGLPTTGGIVLLNFGQPVLPVQDNLSGSIIAGATVLTLNDSSSFPLVYPYEIIINEGSYFEERALVTANDGATQLTIGGGVHGTYWGHSAGTKISLACGKTSVVEYTATSANTLTNSSGVVVESTYPAGIPVTYSATQSIPNAEGYSFPFRMPLDAAFRVRMLLDLIRAAGVQVHIITKR